LGLIGTENSGKEFFIEYLNHYSSSSKLSEEMNEFLLIHKQIPLKLKVFIAEDFEHLITNFETINNLDVIIITLNLNELQSPNKYNRVNFDEFSKIYSFHGISILVGIDLKLIHEGVLSNAMRISRYNLMSKTKELNFIYCYEIQDKNRDLLEIFEKTFDECTFKFQYSNPELFERVISSGKGFAEKNNP